MKNFAWILLIVSSSIFAQEKKEIIGFNSLGQGPEIASSSLIWDGSHLLVSEKHGGNEVFYIKNLTTMHADTLGKVAKWATPTNSTIIFTGEGKAKPLMQFDINRKSIDTLQPQTGGFEAIEKLGYLIAAPKKGKDDKGVSYKLTTVKPLKPSSIGSDTLVAYSISESKNYFTAASKTTLYRVNTTSGQVKSIPFNGFEPKLLITSTEGKFTAIASSNQLLILDDAFKTVTTKQIPEGWSMVSAPKPFFAGETSNLCIYLEPNSDKQEDAKAEGIDIWDWRDVSLVSTETRKSERKQPLKYLWAISSNGALQQIENDTLLRARPVGDGSRYFIATVEHQYLMQRSWETNKIADYYLVDIKEGRTSLFRKASGFYVNSSPNGKYLYWFNTDSSWSFLNIATSKQVKVKPQGNDQFFNIQFDEPSVAGPYAPEGWTGNDEWIVFKAFHDLYMCDPSGVKSTICITNNYGKHNNMQLRITDFDKKRGLNIGDKIVVEGFALATKQSGLYQVTLGKAENPEKLVWGSYRIGNVKVSDNRAIITYTQETYSTYPDIMLLKRNSNKPEQITNVGRYYSKFAFGSARLVEWKNPEGGMLQGMLYLPDSALWQKPYPVVVNIYERKSDNLNLFNKPALAEAEICIPYFVSNGYAVFIPDVVFRVGNPGESSYQCVKSGLEYVLGNYTMLDSSKVGIQGHSWGAYQTAYLITRMGNFKAAVAMAPVSNMVSAYGGLRRGVGNSRMFQYETGQSRIGKTLWQAPDIYIKHSTVLYADKINTPLLMIANDGDGAVPWEQGMELFLAMRRLGKPCWMVNYKGDAHVLNKKENKEDFTKRMMELFDYYLKGKPTPSWIERNINEQ